MHILAQTPRFVIRNFEPAEEDIYLALFDDEEVTRHLPQRSRDENKAMFHNTLADYQAGKPLGRWGIFNNGDGDFIGQCLLRIYDNQADRIELGYVLSKKYWGNGIASEMAQIMIAYALTHTDAREIVAVTTLENTGSQKVLTKAGLERRPNFFRDGKELAFFSLTK
jgi:ribosomal-protein-alanine N-acetyltransferase